MTLIGYQVCEFMDCLAKQRALDKIASEEFEWNGLNYSSMDEDPTTADDAREFVHAPCELLSFTSPFVLL